jgi:hypothetical protein
MVWLPLATVEEVQVELYGAVVSLEKAVDEPSRK